MKRERDEENMEDEIESGRECAEKRDRKEELGKTERRAKIERDRKRV